MTAKCLPVRILYHDRHHFPSGVKREFFYDPELCRQGVPGQSGLYSCHKEGTFRRISVKYELAVPFNKFSMVAEHAER